MKNMKLKAVMLVCSLLLSVFLGACGKSASPSVKPVDTAQETTEKDVAQETVQTENETVEAGKTEKTLEEQALSAYQDILKAAPAIEGEHAELGDASFGYDQNLEQFGNHYELFALYDINQDEIPELIALSTVNFRWTPVSVYTYADGDAVLLTDPLEPTPHGTFEQYSGANGAYVTFICEDGHIHSVWYGTNPMGDAEEENHAYVLAGTTLTAVDCNAEESENTVYFYDIAKTNTAENAAAVMQ